MSLRSIESEQWSPTHSSGPWGSDWNESGPRCPLGTSTPQDKRYTPLLGWTALSQTHRSQQDTEWGQQDPQMDSSDQLDIRSSDRWASQSPEGSSSLDHSSGSPGCWLATTAHTGTVEGPVTCPCSHDQQGIESTSGTHEGTTAHPDRQSPPRWSKDTRCPQDKQCNGRQNLLHTFREGTLMHRDGRCMGTQNPQDKGYTHRHCSEKRCLENTLSARLRYMNSLEGRECNSFDRPTKKRWERYRGSPHRRP